MVGQFFGIQFGHDLHIHGPAGEVAAFDGFVQVALVAFAVFADQGLGLGVAEIFDALLGLEVEFNPEALIRGVDEAEGMAAEPVHVAVGSGDAPIAHDHGYLVQGLGQQGCFLGCAGWCAGRV